MLASRQEFLPKPHPPANAQSKIVGWYRGPSGRTSRAARSSSGQLWAAVVAAAAASSQQQKHGELGEVNPRDYVLGGPEQAG